MDSDAGKPCLVCREADARYFAGRDLGPFCMFHGPEVARWLSHYEGLELDRQRATIKAKAVAYWTGRGIAVGSRVIGQGYTMLGTVRTVRGIAKAGTQGAYVLADQGMGKQHLAPDYFNAEG